MTIWTLLADIMEGIFDLMEDCTLFYGVSVWHLFLLFVVIEDLNAIISSIFGSGDVPS
jgi:hypothetical protein